jgi:hypothetical protein
MKNRLCIVASTAIVSTMLVALSGCGTAPANPLATQQIPAFAGGTSSFSTIERKGMVAELSPDQRKMALRESNGTTTICKIAPQAGSLGQIQTGSYVKATLAEAAAVFPAASGQPPSAGAGVTVIGPLEAGQPGSVVLDTTDTRGKITSIDYSYRVFTVQYASGAGHQFKTPLGESLASLHRGDEVVVRSVQPLVIRVEPR